MRSRAYRYVIVGAGLAGASAADGIRGIDAESPILMLGFERNLPYNRPPLSKELWRGAMEVRDIFIHDDAFYEKRGVELLRGTLAVAIDPSRKTVTDQNGNEYGYDKLLLATGAEPRTLPIPCGTRDAILYYRYLDDYTALRAGLAAGRSVTIIGGGFIGSELAASLTRDKVQVTMILPERYVLNRVFPDYLAAAVQDVFIRNGITMCNEDNAVSIDRDGDNFITATGKGVRTAAHLVVAGIGVTPSTKLARHAGLELDGGIAVDEYLRTSSHDIFAAGDNAVFPYPALGRRMRLEHWDNARSQGERAGRNMAGEREPFTYMPEFYTQMFDLSFMAVGDLRAGYRTVADWQKEDLSGTIYYLDEGRVVGVLYCNVAGDLNEARRIIRHGEVPERLGAAR